MNSKLYSLNQADIAKSALDVVRPHIDINQVYLLEVNIHNETIFHMNVFGNNTPNLKDLLNIERKKHNNIRGSVSVYKSPDNMVRFKVSIFGINNGKDICFLFEKQTEGHYEFFI